MHNLLALTLPGTGNVSLPSQIDTIAKLVADSKSPYGSAIISWAINMAFVGGIIAALLYMIYGGWKWIISNGDAKNLETAHNIIIYAAVGLAVVLLSAAFVNAAATFFCVPLLGPLPQSCH